MIETDKVKKNVNKVLDSKSLKKMSKELVDKAKLKKYQVSVSWMSDGSLYQDQEKNGEIQDKIEELKKTAS